MMYIYIMERTQIYLTMRETKALKRLAKRTGQTRSELIRRAIDEVYLRSPTASKVSEALRRTAGSWKRSESGERLQEQLRRHGRLENLHRSK